MSVETEIRQHVEEIAYPQLEEMIREWIGSGKLGSPYSVLERIFMIMKAKGEVIVPVSNKYDEAGNKIGFTVRTMKTDDKKHYVPAFSRAVYAEKGGSRMDVIAFPLERLAQIAAGDEECAGIVLGPWTYDFVIPHDVCRFFTEQKA